MFNNYNQAVNADGQTDEEVREELRMRHERLNVYAKPQPADAPLDLNQIEEKLDSLSRRYDSLAVDPSANILEMDDIQGRMDKLFAQKQKADAQTRAYQQSQFAPEVDALGNDIAVITTKLEELSINPGENFAQIQTLNAELDKRVKRVEAIESGSVSYNLQWKGG